MNGIFDHDLISIQEARILAEEAAQAQKQLMTFSQQDLDHIVERIAEEAEKYARELAILSAEETEYGRWQDKEKKNIFVCQKVKSALRDMRCVGIIEKNPWEHTMDIGVPRGTIAALCPATSPVSTTIYKVLIAVKAGCSIIFAPHPRAERSMSRVLDIIMETAERNGLPKGAISYLHTVATAGTLELLGHKNVALLLLTGVPSMMKPAAGTGKPMIFGGTGNGPSFIERTADIPSAVRHIVQSKTFDYGAMTAAEQSVVVDAPVSESVKKEFQRLGAYFMSEEEADKLGKLLFLPDGSANKEMVGKSAPFLAAAAGIAVSEDTTLLISEQKYVSEKNPYSREKLSPVLAYYVEDDWIHACEKCIELLLSERQGHTLVIHSQDEDVIEQFALKKPVARMLVNTPASLGGIGMTTDLFPAMTLGSGSVGMGATADNVSPMNLIYIRKVGYGVREAGEAYCAEPVQADCRKPDRDTLKRKILDSMNKCF